MRAILKPKPKLDHVQNIPLALILTQNEIKDLAMANKALCVPGSAPSLTSIMTAPPPYSLHQACFHHKAFYLLVPIPPYSFPREPSSWLPHFVLDLAQMSFDFPIKLPPSTWATLSLTLSSFYDSL